MGYVSQTQSLKSWQGTRVAGRRRSLNHKEKVKKKS
jgi:hypothetical protein